MDANRGRTRRRDAVVVGTYGTEIFNRAAPTEHHNGRLRNRRRHRRRHHCLSCARENRHVILVDDGPVGGGMTSRTTAHLVNAIDDRYIDIEKFLGEECARLTAESHTAAIHCAEEIAREHNIDCDFERVDGYLFLPPGGSVKELMEELEAIHRAGLRDVARVDSVPNTKINSDAVLRFPRQAEFHPLKYLNALAEVIVDSGGKIFTGTRV